MFKKLTLVCLLNFFIAVLMGLALRYNSIHPLDIEYRFLTHGHSHIAMLGWVYLMLYVLIIEYFIPIQKPVYKRLFWLTEFSIIGMMISFPLQGYGAVSISFSTLHILCSYYFVNLIWKHHKASSPSVVRLLKASLLFMFISTLGVWCLGPVVSTLGQTSAFYQTAIQFFLHFQFNGWFLFAVLAVFIHLLKLNDSKEFRNFFRLLIASTILTFALPIYWFVPEQFLLWINGLGVIIQLYAFFLFLKAIGSKFIQMTKHCTKLTVFLYYFAAFCLVLKIGLQLLSLIPEVSQIAYQHRNFVIGFIHLNMLGVISGFLLSFILNTIQIKSNTLLSLGVYTFVTGFTITELLLVVQGYLYYTGNGLMANYYLYLFLASCLMPFGILSIIISIYRTNQKSTQTLDKLSSP